MARAARVPPTPFMVDRPTGAVRFGDGDAGGCRPSACAAGPRSATPGPAHVRLDLDLSDDRRDRRPRPSTRPERRGGSPPIELARTCRPTGAAARALAHLDLAGRRRARILAFTTGHDTTQPATLDAVRAWRGRQARAAAPIATGTAGDMARIHLAPAPLSGRTP